MTASEQQQLDIVAHLLNIQPLWLENVMWIESKLNPQAVNKTTGATGLIQFMPATAKALGTTVEALKQMSFEEQLEYVYLYLKPYIGKMVSQVDVYLAVFFPVAIGKPDSYVLQTSKLSPELIAKQNSGYDLNKDKQLTKGEVATAIQRILQKKK